MATACGGRPGRQSLERTLALTLGGLVLAAILVLAISAVGLLRKQAEQQALAQRAVGGRCRARRDPAAWRGTPHGDTRARDPHSRCSA